MRICLTTIAGPMHSTGGLQDHAATIAGGLVAAGHEVDIISTTHPEGLEEQELDGARWLFVDAPRHHLDTTWLRRSTERFLAEHGKRPYDVINSESSSGLGLVHAGIHRRVPFVITFQGNFITYARAYASRAAKARSPHAVLREAKGLAMLALRDHFPRGNWRLFRDCEAIVPSKAQLDDTIRSHRLRRERTHVVPNGIDLARWHPEPREPARQALGISDDRMVFACVGRLNRGKGVAEAVRALAEVRRTTAPDALLLVAGDGPELEPLRRDVAAANVGEAVRFLGRLDRDGVRGVMSAADALVFPTTHREAGPLVVPQALACHLPVVASDIGAIPEVIGDGAGLLVPPADVPALTAAMAKLAESPALREQLAAAGDIVVRDRYSIEAMVRGTLAVFESARAYV
jgi:glycosyltransferase involved in cell wall biosynthesis